MKPKFNKPNLDNEDLKTSKRLANNCFSKLATEQIKDFANIEMVRDEILSTETWKNDMLLSFNANESMVVFLLIFQQLLTQSILAILENVCFNYFYIMNG